MSRQCRARLCCGRSDRRDRVVDLGIRAGDVARPSGRRPPQRVDSLVMPASENLHNSSHGTHPELEATVAKESATDVA